MKHLWCWLALGCALVCYGQRVAENRVWLTLPLAVVIAMSGMLGWLGFCAWFFVKIGWFR